MLGICINEGFASPGSSTACVVVLQGDAGHLYSANIGDSGFVVVRNGSVVHRSQEQQHYFNTPFQLSLPPPGTNAQVLSDRPESAETLEFLVKEGDMLMVATDGVFDNLPDSLIVKEMVKVQGSTDLLLLQQAANSLAQQARKLAFDEDYMSPFARSARENGINAIARRNNGVGVHLYAASPSATMTGRSFSPSLEMSRTRNLGKFTINLRFTSDMHFFMSS
ncbi:Protein phosphatase PTC7 [Portunus trituberculatus]|uniref:Protein phosphatase n=1 Tax=Portunus trituberculatus TaxID=210409 RepID=A0A5B7E5R4_PORTR|nr:Protein phosphatase PTC7 [Portunus trituberculatus]